MCYCLIDLHILGFEHKTLAAELPLTNRGKYSSSALTSDVAVWHGTAIYPNPPLSIPCSSAYVCFPKHNIPINLGEVLLNCEIVIFFMEC